MPARWQLPALFLICKYLFQIPLLAITFFSKFFIFSYIPNGVGGTMEEKRANISEVPD